MIIVKKKMKKSLLMAILAGVLAVLTVGAIVVNTVIAGRTGNTSGSTGSSQATNLPTVRPELGEYDYGGAPYVFYPVERTQMEYIQIRTKSFDKNGDPYTYEYSFLKEETLGDAFVLSYTDKDGNSKTYLPPILSYDSETDYSSLYAVEQSTGYDIPLLFWLCSGIGNIKFSARVDLSENEAEMEKELSAYGLSESDAPILIRFNYTKTDKTKEDIVLQVGDSLPSGGGYYFRVGSIVNDVATGPSIKYRPCVYTTYDQSSLSYAFLHFADFINPVLVAEGLESDNAFEPYLTTDFKQWKNTSYLYNEEKGIAYVMDGDGKIYLLPDTATAVANNAYLVLANGNKVSTDSDYGILAERDMFEFIISTLNKSENGKKLLNVLKNKQTGKKDSPITVTLPSYMNQVDFDDDKDDTYTYHITSIDAVLTDTEDLTNVGTAVESGSKVKIKYTLTKNGSVVADSKGNAIVFGGVLDLSSSLVPDEAKTALVGKTVGGEVDVTFTVAYTTENTEKREFKLYIDEIIDIRSATDTNKKLDTVQVGALVSLRVYDVVDGVKADTPYTLPIIITEEMTGRDANVKEAIMGKSTTRGFNTTVNAYVASLEIMQGYTYYELDEILGYTSREEIVSFRYTQDSDRDPYYGESLYTNTMQDWRQRLYALEAGSCEKVVQILGGLLENANHSEGLAGFKTVDVVITPAKMLQYGLYANTIYFELPRNIFPVSKDSSDYTYLSTLGFTLYVSDVNPATKTRYIASSLYDVVAEIKADGFEFLDETFLSLYARKNLVLTGVENLHNVEIEFFMDELHGTYTNIVEDYKVYGYNGKFYASIADIQKKFGEDAINDIAVSSIIRIKSDYKAHCSECAHKASVLEQQLNSLGNPDGIYLDVLYGNKTTPSGEDFLGSDSFKEFMGTLFYTIYENQVSEENLDNVKSENLLMRMSVDLGKEYTQNTGIYRYVYEFYRVSDRRIAVRIYQQDASGSIIKDSSGKEIISTDFYISEFAFKKLVSKYWEVVNAIPVNKEDAFTSFDVVN